MIESIINKQNPTTLLFTPSIKFNPFKIIRIQKDVNKILRILFLIRNLKNLSLSSKL